MPKYIELEKIRKIYWNKCDMDIVGDMIEEIEALQTIDPEATIDEMIEEYWFWWEKSEILETLEELKSRLSLNK